MDGKLVLSDLEEVYGRLASVFTLAATAFY